MNYGEMINAIVVLLEVVRCSEIDQKERIKANDKIGELINLLK